MVTANDLTKLKWSTNYRRELGYRTVRFLITLNDLGL